MTAVLIVLQAAGGWWLAAVGSGGAGGGVVEKAMARAYTIVHPCRKITTLGPTEQRVEDRQRKQQSRVQQEKTTPNPRHQEHKES